MTDTLRCLNDWVTLPETRGWFSQTFTRLCLVVTDTGEVFTLVMQGAQVEVLGGRHVPARRRTTLFQWLGFDPSRWWAEQFVMSLDSQRLRAWTAAFAGDLSTAQGQYGVIAPMIWPLLEGLYAMPVMRSRFWLALAGIERFWQEALLDPAGNETERVTVVHMGGKWQVIAGYHGCPRHRYLIRPSHVLEEQRRFHQADVADSLAGWLALSRWYHQYRQGVATRPYGEAGKPRPTGVRLDKQGVP